MNLASFRVRFTTGGHDVGVSFDEASIEVGKAQNSADVVEVDEVFPVHDSIDLRGVHADSILSDDETEVVYGGFMEFALHGLKVEPFLAEYLENLANVNLVFLQRSTVDLDVVEVCGADVVEEGQKDIVDEMLEVGRAVGKTKGHDKGFKEAIAGAERCLPFLWFCDPDQVVRATDIQHSVVLGLGETVHGFSDERQMVSVFDRSLVEATVIET